MWERTLALWVCELAEHALTGVSVVEKGVISPAEATVAQSLVDAWTGVDDDEGGLTALGGVLGKGEGRAREG